MKQHGAIGTSEDKDNDNGLIYIIVGVVALISVFVILSIYLYVRLRRKSHLVRKFNGIELRRFERGNADGINSHLTLEQQAELLPYDKKYEFPRDRIKLGKQLGGGAFGVVYEGIAQRIVPYEEKTKVAVKMVHKMSNDEVCSSMEFSSSKKSHNLCLPSR